MHIKVYSIQIDILVSWQMMNINNSSIWCALAVCGKAFWWHELYRGWDHTGNSTWNLDILSGPSNHSPSPKPKKGATWHTYWKVASPLRSPTTGGFFWGWRYKIKGYLLSAFWVTNSIFVDGHCGDIVNEMSKDPVGWMLGVLSSFSDPLAPPAGCNCNSYTSGSLDKGEMSWTKTGKHHYSQHFVVFLTAHFPFGGHIFSALGEHDLDPLRCF